MMEYNTQNNHLKAVSPLQNIKQHLQEPLRIPLRSKYKTFYKILFVIIFITSVTFFSVITYNSYIYSKIPTNVNDIPLVRADLSPIKIIPVAPGGEQFSNQDKLIYTTLENKNFALTQDALVTPKEDIYNDVKEIRVPPAPPKKTIKDAPKKNEINEDNLKKTIPNVTKNSPKKNVSGSKASKSLKKNNPFDLLDDN